MDLVMRTVGIDKDYLWKIQLGQRFDVDIFTPKA